jgi:hypothetical protein
MANERRWPVVVFWCGLIDGVLSRSFTVKPYAPRIGDKLKMPGRTIQFFRKGNDEH